MFVKVADNEIIEDPVRKGSGEGWYWYEGVHPHDTRVQRGYLDIINDDVATGVCS